MPANAPPAAKPQTRRASMIEGSAHPNSSDSSATPASKNDKLKSLKEGAESKDKKEGSKDGKEKSSKTDQSEQSKLDIAAELNFFRKDLSQMILESEKRMSNLIKESESRMSDKLNKIEKNFSVKIGELREEMKTEMKSVKEEIENTKATVNLEVNSMKETVSAVEKSIQDTSDRMTDLENSQEEKIKAATEKLDEKILVLDTKLKLLEKQDRKYNLLFYGFPEESGENVYEIIRQSLITELKLEEENVRNMYFAAGHRVPTKAAGPNPIIIRCTSLEDRDLILSESKKYGGLKKRVVIDWPKDMKEERSRLSKIAYEIRKSEKPIQTRIKDKGLEVFLEVRKDETEKWKKRVV